ncbi:hypothetical protein HII31_06438 [Pseudocercospora fuligena]|uniref:Uncharacterized protein n=1 Tax=Pseudocercospora fuligena TaxID=685502 RepID=A0A8H6RH53_9PEZI|nr:hypothetical protein HII31_06438 [Pseudocercospora fuligena]
MPYIWEAHHCWCSTKEHPVNAPHGDHHQFCSVHTNYYVRTGNPCDKCEEEAERQAKRERDERERAKKQRELEAAEAWFKEDRKERKPRSAEKRKRYMMVDQDCG